MASQEEQGKKKSLIVRTWESLGLNTNVCLNMVKFALPPTISLCIYQSDVIARTYSTTGYLIAIGSILSSGLAPRAAYIEATICNVFFVSATTGVVTFAMWTVYKARETTEAPGSPSSAYNSSASAVAGIWLFVLLYVINSLKFTRAQFKFGCVMASIVIVVALTYAPQFPDFTQALSLLRNIYGSLMTGIAITTGISLSINPTSCRDIVFRDISQYIAQLRKTLDCQRTYMASVENLNPFKEHAEAKDLLAAVQALRTTHGSLFAQMGPAKKEIAYGRLLASDISEIQRILRRAFLPIVGTSSVIRIFQRLAQQHGWGDKETDIETASESDLSSQYQDVFRSLHEPIERLHQALHVAFDHVLLRLKLKGWKSVRDSISRIEKPETRSDVPGQDGVADYVENEIEHYYATRVDVLQAWCARHGIELEPGSLESDFDWITNEGETLFGTPIQRQLLIVLYIEALQYSGAKAILNLVRFADSKIADGTMLKRRLILPGRKTVAKWLGTFARSDTSEDSLDSHNGETQVSGGTSHTLWTETFKSQKDPEHLPQTNPLQNVGVGLRSIGSVFRSQHSQFGFRVAVACMSIQICAFLRYSQNFFVEQRLFWASIMVVVSMTRTSGEASFIYFLRICGTFLGAIAAYVIWYIVDGHTAGVLVFYFVIITLFGYVPNKIPRLALATVIAAVTATIVIGYEQQVKKIGTQAATTNKQEYYPIYILSPYRFATTAAGIFVAYVFTIFPFPISEGAELRKELGVALFTLASHYSLVQETVVAHISGIQGDLSIKTSPGRKLERARVKLMSRQMLLIQSMRQQLNFTKYQMPLDTPFPRQTYGELIDVCENMLNFVSLIGFMSANFAVKTGDPDVQEWQEEFGGLLENVQKTSDEVTSLLCLLSSSIINSQPLPPHLHLPRPYSLLQQMQAHNRNILNISHAAERGYAAFAVLQIASRSITLDLYKLVDHVKELVGELDFSIPYTSTALSRYTTGLSRLATNKSKQRKALESGGTDKSSTLESRPSDQQNEKQKNA